MINFILQLFRPRLGVRSSKWRKVRKEHIKWNWKCECCNNLKKLEVHHIVPYHIAPELELDEKNLITLCRRCHLLIGHLDKWDRHNAEVVKDSKHLNEKITKQIYGR